MRWQFLQLTIFGLVMAGNIHWAWTPNPYVASLLAMGCAYAATVSLSWTIDRLPRRKRRQ